MVKWMRLSAMSVGTIACALGIGFVMQWGNPTPPDRRVAEVAPEPGATLAQLVARNEPLPLESITLTSARDDNRIAEPAKPIAAPADPLPKVASAVDCAVKAAALTEPGAMIRLIVDAPCHGNDRVTVHHSGLMFTDVTSDEGLLEVEMPALAENAVVIVELSNGAGAVASTKVVSLPFYDRVAVQWAGKSGFQIHAREFGASYGEAGHVWSGDAGSTASAAMGDAGFVTRLGRADTLAPRIAEIYTFPTSAAKRTGTISMSIEAEVTSENCGREIGAQALELRPGQTLRTQDLSLSVPDCAAIGDFLVLNNLLDDLKIASN